MTRFLLFTATAGLLATPSCSGPIAGYDSVATPKIKKSHTGSVAASSVTHDGQGTVEQITVKGERLKAADVWRQDRRELREKATVATPAQFRQFVVERSGTLIAEKVNEMLLYQEASRRLVPEVAENVERFLTAEIRKIVTEKFDGIQRRYEKHLETEGRTLDDVREALRRQYMIEAYLNSNIQPKVGEPTRVRLWEEYESLVEARRRAVRRSMSLIDVRFADFLAEGNMAPTRDELNAARKKARTQIEAARAAQLGGTVFAETARRYSHGLHAAEGGAWGWVDAQSVRERFVPALQALEGLQTEEVSEIVTGPDAFFLVRCDHFESGETPDFQSLQPELIERYAEAEQSRLLVELLSALQEDVRLEPVLLDRFHSAVVADALAFTEGFGR